MTEEAKKTADGNLAPVGKRIVAAIIDGVLLAIVGSVLMMVLGGGGQEVIVIGGGGYGAVYKPGIGFYIAQILTLAVSTAYFAYFEGGAKQASIGKNIMGMKVAFETGKALDLKEAGKRALILSAFYYVPNILMPILGSIANVLSLAGLVAVAIILFNDKRQGAHDMICKTLVVNA